jgi:hypothetical protein
MRIKIHAQRHRLQLTMQFKDVSELNHTHRAHCQHLPVIFHTSGQKGLTAIVFGDIGNAYIGKVSREGAGALGAGVDEPDGLLSNEKAVSG